MSAAIFISYRRSDTAGHAGRLFDRLLHWHDHDVLSMNTGSLTAMLAAFDATDRLPGATTP